MKLAEHWVDELDANETGVAVCTASEIKQIQADAIKEAILACRCPKQFTGTVSSTRKEAWLECERKITELLENL